MKDRADRLFPLDRHKGSDELKTLCSGRCRAPAREHPDDESGSCGESCIISGKPTCNRMREAEGPFPILAGNADGLWSGDDPDGEALPPNRPASALQRCGSKLRRSASISRSTGGNSKPPKVNAVTEICIHCQFSRAWRAALRNEYSRWARVSVVEVKQTRVALPSGMVLSVRCGICLQYLGLPKVRYR